MRSHTTSTLTAMIAALAIANKTVKSKRALPPMTYGFKELDKIPVERINVDLIVADLTKNHETYVRFIYSTLSEKYEELNDFIEWNNDFLAQLLFCAGKICVEKLEDLYHLYKNNPRYRSIVNTIETLYGAFKNLIGDKLLYRLLSADESKNNYPLSKQGITFLDEYGNLLLRYNHVISKLAIFQKSQK